MAVLYSKLFQWQTGACYTVLLGVLNCLHQRRVIIWAAEAKPNVSDCSWFHHKCPSSQFGSLALTSLIGVPLLSCREFHGEKLFPVSKQISGLWFLTPAPKIYCFFYLINLLTSGLNSGSVIGSSSTLYPFDSTRHRRDVSLRVLSPVTAQQHNMVGLQHAIHLSMPQLLANIFQLSVFTEHNTKSLRPQS